MVHRYVLRKSVLTYLLNRGVSVKCRVCEQTVKVGEKVVSKRAGRFNITTKLYHPACWESLFLVC